MLLFQSTAEKRASCEQSSFENTSSGRWHAGEVGRRRSLVAGVVLDALHLYPADINCRRLFFLEADLQQTEQLSRSHSDLENRSSRFNPDSNGNTSVLLFTLKELPQRDPHPTQLRTRWKLNWILHKRVPCIPLQLISGIHVAKHVINVLFGYSESDLKATAIDRIYFVFDFGKKHHEFIPSHLILPFVVRLHTMSLLFKLTNSPRTLSAASHSFIIWFWFIWWRMCHKYMSNTEWMTNSTAKWNVGLRRQTTLRCKCAWDPINYVSLCGAGTGYVQSWYGLDMLFIMHCRLPLTKEKKKK